MQRREFLAGAAALAATGAAAAPVLTADNFGLTPATAARHNGWIEVDAQAFIANIAEVRRVIGSARLCAVMKADAYGNGIALLIPAIIASRVADVGITSNDEARVARKLGYRGRLLRLRAATQAEMADGFRHGITELIGNADAAAGLAALWRKHGSRRPLPVQLGINAGGMSRNGIELASDYGKADVRAMLALPGLAITDVMTHYPSEEADDILAQLRCFEADVAWLQGLGLNTQSLLRHTANSFAALTQPASHLDMVRVGGLLYGDLGSLKSDRYIPTMTIKSQVAAVNHYPAGQTVNYDRTYVLERESWLANVPLGYSDGVRRGFSHANRPQFAAETRNNTQVLIGGRRFPVVGRVTMNTLMVDVTDRHNDVRLGDEVVLFGAQGTERIGQTELEANSGAYGPDLLTMLGNSLPRVLMAG